jgi:hypothetical protein
MIPVGYLRKRVVSNAELLHAVGMVEFWKHNGYWLFDSPSTRWEGP